MRCGQWWQQPLDPGLLSPGWQPWGVLLPHSSGPRVSEVATPWVSGSVLCSGSHWRPSWALPPHLFYWFCKHLCSMPSCLKCLVLNPGDVCSFHLPGVTDLELLYFHFEKPKARSLISQAWRRGPSDIPSCGQRDRVT